MRMIFRHSYTMLRYLVFWRRGAGIVAMIPALWIHLLCVILYDVRLFWPRTEEGLGVSYFPGKFEMGVVLGAAVVGLLMALGSQVDIKTWVPHATLPLTVRGRAMGESLSLLVAWLTGGLATIWLLAFFGISPGLLGDSLGLIHGPADMARFSISCALWLPLVTVLALHFHAGQFGTGILMAAVLAAVEMLTDNLGFLDTRPGTLAVSLALMAAVLLLGSRPRIRSIVGEVPDPSLDDGDDGSADDWVAAHPILAWPGGHGDSSPRWAADPDDFEVALLDTGDRAPSPGSLLLTTLTEESIHRPAMDPVTQLRRDTWIVTEQFLKLFFLLNIMMGPVVLVLWYFGLWNDWGYAALLPAGFVLAIIAELTKSEAGIPLETVGANPGGDWGTRFRRASAMLALPREALGRAWLRQAATLAGVVAAVFLAWGGVAAILKGPLASRSFFGVAIAIVILTPGICGMMIASAMGEFKDRAIVGLALTVAGFAMMFMITSLVLKFGGQTYCVLLAAPVSVFGGLLPVRRFLVAPSPEVTHGRV
ncbi:MAG: hypothetical protein O7H41_05270 [Planctomycetota bacterium]|nr:hypothetical protein [Planctomycetota bacterium]